MIIVRYADDTVIGFEREADGLREIKEGLRQRRQLPIPDTGKWLGQIVAGYFAYHAVPTNSAAIGAFRYHVTVLWHRRLCRRSQKARLVWPRMAKLTDDFLPKAAGPSSLAQCALCCQTPEIGAECPNWARSDLCGGRSAMNVPTVNIYERERVITHRCQPARVREPARNFSAKIFFFRKRLPSSILSG
jgi:hypothetical protein